MNKDNKNLQKEEIINSFIDDLTKEMKPRAYKELNDKEIEELEDLFETIRAVKRLKKDNNEKRVKNKKKFSLIRLTAIAAVLALVITAGSLFRVPFINNLENNNETEFFGSNNIVYAMVEAYEELISYSGTIEIRSLNNGAIDYIETIDVRYKKPNKYVAVHEYDGYKRTMISDGEKLYTVEGNNVTVDYSNPKKELWRYHIGKQIQELTQAEEVIKIGSETILGREADIFKYRFADSDIYNKIWVDKKTKLPLKKELNLPEDRKLINQFISLEINPEIEDTAFNYQIGDNKNVVQLNEKVDISEVKESWKGTEKLINQVSQELQLISTVRLEDNIIYDYLLKFTEASSEEYLDVYVTIEPKTDYYVKDAEHGQLGTGWVEINKDAINVFKVYIGESNLVKWVTKDFEVVMVSNIDTDKMVRILESIQGEKIKQINEKELNELGIKQVQTKTNH
ncbi:sigma-E factor regulatory protein RseB domain-containing protein [Caldisalinibacter kiritimatiensis]|uniref:MucB/RseB N-terminal domain-containing protein n=1 Tax=Caldisalinibacter kiritimatiensis TaxID=1304284 RepID=R1CB20_9FIRM|nr:sigma-E factor regulatory protein RseB domain-containing protein [Caldisalinibacter kiritimatiensis]EOC99489.1 hypothetical protein L21TH_2494 [Caldisalinibacter kiritimatiensis]